MPVPAHLLGRLVGPRGTAPGGALPRRTRAGMCGSTCESVLSNTDLVARILSGHVGVSTFVAARAVCKAWHAACSEDTTLVAAVACYAGSLTKRDFMGLLRLSSTEADAYPRERHQRFRGGHYYLYNIDAFEKALCDIGGLAGWRVRKSPTSLARDRWVTCRVNHNTAPTWWCAKQLYRPAV